MVGCRPRPVTRSCSPGRRRCRPKPPQVLAELDLDQLFADVGPVLVVGSYLSGLMCWRDLDVCLLAGEEYSPSDVLELLKRVVALPGLVGFSHRDERGSDAPPARPETSATTCP
jgi:hypothetical protein